MTDQPDEEAPAQLAQHLAMTGSLSDGQRFIVIDYLWALQQRLDDERDG